jgi:hypothetical protein
MIIIKKNELFILLLIKYILNNKMKTRSQNNLTTLTPISTFNVEIDFDDASKAWKSNKKSIGNGSYKYICTQKLKNGNSCSLQCLSGEIYCKTHLKMSKNNKI